MCIRDSKNSAPIQGDLFANFAGEGTGVSENSNLTRLEMLDVDYQLIATEDQRADIIQKLLTSEILSIDTETTGTCLLYTSRCVYETD